MTTTAAEYREIASEKRAEAAESFERCDTDGFMSQWASGLGAVKADKEAELAENGGKANFNALFLLDGTVASTHEAKGQYGYYWILNDKAAAELGKRFITDSSARKNVTRKANNRKKGITLGTIRCAAYVDYRGETLTSVRPCTLPDIDALRAGEYEIVTPEFDITDW